MKSITFNHKAKNLRSGYTVSDSQLVIELDEEDQRRTAVERLSVELQTAAIECKIGMFVAGVYEFFEADAETQLVMHGWLEGSPALTSWSIWALIKRHLKSFPSGFGERAPRDGRREAFLSVNKSWTREETERVLEELAASIEAPEPD